MKEMKSAARAGRFFLVIQLLALIVGIIFTSLYGELPSSVEGYFEMYNQNYVVALIRDDLYNVVIIFSYIFTMGTIFYVLVKEKSNKKVIVCYTYLCIVISVIIMLAVQSNFSMRYLSNAYEITESAQRKVDLLVAGEGVLAGNMWNSSAGFFSGILMQGGCLVLTIFLIGNKMFSKGVVIAGIICNSLDLVNHLIHFDFPYLANVFLYIAGPAYVVWYICLLRDFIRIEKSIEVNYEEK
jgi:hypothetical protein